MTNAISTPNPNLLAERVRKQKDFKWRADEAMLVVMNILETQHPKADVDKALKDIALDLYTILVEHNED